jgi:hypothetical protein
MTLEMRKKLAQESYEEKIRKVGMLIRLIKKAPKLGRPAPEGEQLNDYGALQSGAASSVGH